MDRVTTNDDDTAGRVLGLLRGAYLTAAEAQQIRCAVGECEGRRIARELRHYAKGGEPLQVVPVDWTADLEAEAVAQGQDGPDPVYEVAPRFGGVEYRPTPTDPFEGFPDLPLGYTPAPAARRVGGEPWEPEDVGPGLGDGPIDPDAPIPLELADPAADDDADDTPLVVPPFTDEQEGE